MPNYILSYLRNNQIDSNDPILSALCSIPRDVLDSISNSGLSDQEKVNDAMCVAYYRMGGQGACATSQCFYNPNINGSCRSLAARNFLMNIQPESQQNIPPVFTQQAVETQPINIVNLAPTQQVRVEIEQKYSDEDCKTLKDRGFDVYCTYNDDREDGCTS